MKLTPKKTVTKSTQCPMEHKKRRYSSFNNEKEWDGGNDTNLRVSAKTLSYKKWKDGSIRHSIEITKRRASIGKVKQNKKQEKQLSMISSDLHSLK